MKRSEDPADRIIERLCELSLTLAASLAAASRPKDVADRRQAFENDLANAARSTRYATAMENLSEQLDLIAKGDADAIRRWRRPPQPRIGK
jgi:hypothetical protein